MDISCRYAPLPAHSLYFLKRFYYFVLASCAASVREERIVSED